MSAGKQFILKPYWVGVGGIGLAWGGHPQTSNMASDGAGRPESITGGQMLLSIKQEHRILHPIAHEKFSESLKILRQDFWKPSKSDLENKPHAAAN